MKEKKMSDVQRLKQDYPWIQTPLVVGAPMRLIALADLAVEVSKAGGIGFIGAGTDTSSLSTYFQHAQRLLGASALATKNGTMPIGVGFINWGADIDVAVSLIQKYRPAAVWFFAPSSTASLMQWTEKSREACPETKVWVQVGSVQEAMGAVRETKPDVLVVQGTDAGGHGLAQGAGLISLVPEVCDAVETYFSRDGGAGGERPVIIAAGGIAEQRSAAAAMTLGASGVVLGTRLLASYEANISKGYRDEVLRASDGGQTTVRTKVYDTLRNTNWAATHNARGVINKTYFDAMDGMGEEENRRLYTEETNKGDAGWGVENRMTTYAGSAVGLVKEVKGAGEIVREMRGQIGGVLDRAKAIL
ncbi:oxidoreductase 2-nitropropane dioxygenase [Clathrospora elynae]|uniref:Oxidoreductase 2-nitropropane dioxygenase n=1 Tax=Clathrospora elynae TaxID=706981 RepID=A0A6A5SZJ8_9PLEO|nr:oxidoreductase 2-nitropropane dioxygenase [Clathrospora elynae]